MSSPIKFDVVLTNPPFGVKGSVARGRERGAEDVSAEFATARPEFWAQTANKQLNFLQHVVTLLKRGGRAAVVVPDNVLFESGAAATIRRKLLETCRVHTLLRLPAGLFYAQGIKANVLFFDRSLTGSHQNGLLWVYDLRKGNKFSVKTRPLVNKDLEDFVRCYRQRTPKTTAGSVRLTDHQRWKPFKVSDLLRSPSCCLDLAWGELKPPSGLGGVSGLDEIASLIQADLQHALRHISLFAGEGV
jgi:type I restriction enzyme M protein